MDDWRQRFYAELKKPREVEHLDSSSGQFIGDPRVRLIPFTNTAPDADDSETPVTHLGLMFNPDVQEQILKILGASYDRNADISTTLHSDFAPHMSTAANVVRNIIGGSILGAILDPVEGFVVDGQGRRLGFSAATGPVTEIPGSVWFGNTDGIGWVLQPLVEPLSLQLSGLGSNYYTMVSVLGETGSSGLIERGALGLGEQRVLPIPTTTNTSPIANAGPDQTVECASPCAVVTLDGSASFDPDGDTLTYQWSWAGGSASGMAPSVTLPAGAHTVTLTVDDGHGAATSDAVTITVRDTTAPTLTVPANMTADATGPGGAAVNYAASASDIVSGSIVPLCSPASGTTFPIGATTVTCTAADGAGNSATASFRITVNDVTTPGEMHGAGFIKSNGAKYSFEFRIVEQAKRDEERGRFRLEINNDEKKKKNDTFVMTDLTFVAFSDDPAYHPGRKARPNIDTVDFHGIGEWNGQPGYRLQVHAADEGEPGRHRESITIVITDPSGRAMVSIGGVLSGGNVQSTRVRH